MFLTASTTLPAVLVLSLANMSKRRFTNGEHSAPKRERGYHGAKSMAGSNPPAFPKTDTKRGFFDLPRELRDTIYGYSITSMSRHKHRNYPKSISARQPICRCDQSRRFVLSPRPPYFAYDLEHCLVTDRWLYSVSSISKQFAEEIRTIFFQRTLFSLEYPSRAPPAQRSSLGHPSTFHYEEFIRALGPKAQELRRLEITLTADAPEEESRDRTGPKNAFGIGDAENELERLRGLLHPNVEIFLTMRHHNRAQSICFFHCTSSNDEKRAFMARKVDINAYIRWLTANS